MSLTCTVTGRTIETKTERMPSGWKRTPSGEPVSPEGWKSLYVQRSIVIPIAGPIGAEWSDLRDSLKSAWAGTTRLSNWILRQLAIRDITRAPGDKKIGKQPAWNEGTSLYLSARAFAPELLDSGSVSMIVRNAQQRYAEDRYEIVWRGSKSLPSYRYPTPYPIRQQDWSAVWHKQEDKSDPVPAINVRINGTRFLLRLRSGHQYRRQLAAFRQITNGTALPGAISLYEIGAHANDNRSESSKGKRLVVRISVHLPRVDGNGKSGVMLVSTGKDALITAHIDGRDPWKLHASHVRRWVAEYRKRMQDMSDDQKFERRRPKRQQRDMQEARDRWSAKQRHRLDSITHEASAQLAGLANRNRVAKVIYDDSDRSFVESFPWHELRTKIEYKLDAFGISFEVASGPVMQETPDALANNGKEGR